MKAIKFSDVMILKEKNRQLDREDNYYYLTLKTDIIYGTLYSESLSESIQEFSLQITKDVFPDLWSNTKDLENGDLIDFIYDEFDKFKEGLTEEGEIPNDDPDFMFGMEPFLDIFGFLKDKEVSLMEL